MNINDVLKGHFNLAGSLEQLAHDLEAAGHVISAAEIRREISGAAGQLGALDQTLNNNKVVIYDAQEAAASNAAEQWLGLIEKGVA